MGEPTKYAEIRIDKEVATEDKHQNEEEMPPIHKGNQVKRTLNANEDFFFQELGPFIRSMREAAGFTSMRVFVGTIEMSYSQYQGYESGKI